MPLDFPNNPTNGQTYNGYVYNSSIPGWQAKPAAQSPFYTGAIAPTNPATGDSWWNTNDGTMYVYYNDGNSSQWVEARAPITSDGYTSPNYIINGAFEINQRGFTSTTSAGYGFDRWRTSTSGGTVTYSKQSFTPGTAPAASIEGTNFARVVTSGQSAATDYAMLTQLIEDVRTLAGSTVTVSFWAKAASGSPKVSVELAQGFGSGGSSATFNYAGQVTLSTSWVRYSVTTTLPSIAGKTIGTDNLLQVALFVSAGSNYNSRLNSLGTQANTFDFWGVQVEDGAVATPFRRNANSLQGELAACQRYYYRQDCSGSNGAYQWFASGGSSSTATFVPFTFPVEMRTLPTMSSSAGSTFAGIPSGTVSSVTSANDGSNRKIYGVFFNGSGFGAGTTIRANNNTSAYIDFSAEL